MQYERYFDGRLIMSADTSVGWFEGTYSGNMPLDVDGQGLMIDNVSPETARRIKDGDEEALLTVVERVGENIYKGKDGRILSIATKIRNSGYSYVPLDTYVKEINPPVGEVLSERLQRLSSLMLSQSRL